MAQGPRSAEGMSLIEYFEKRKQQCEADLRYAETQPGFRLFQVTAGGGQVDKTEEHKRHLRDAHDEYQRAIDYLKASC